MNPLLDRPLTFGDAEQIAEIKRIEKEKDKCKECEGRGVRERDCDYCDGFGTVDDDCEDCDGTGIKKGGEHDN